MARGRRFAHAVLAAAVVTMTFGVQQARADTRTAPRHALAVKRAAGMMRRGTATRVGLSVSPHLDYSGGPVLQRPKVVMVLWGAGTYLSEVDTSSSAPDFPSFFGGVLNSPYMDWLQEYAEHNHAVGRGSFVSRVEITPAAGNNGATIDDAANIQPELKSQIEASNLPAPDARTLYVLFFPQGKTITNDGTDNINDFCAYHGDTLMGATDIPYAVIPDSAQQAPGCGLNPGFDNMTAVTSHEVIETATDPFLGTWFDLNTGDEISDICNGDQSTQLGGDGRTYTVQTQWSNQQTNCVTSGPSRKISVGNGSVEEGDSGSHQIRFAVTLSSLSNHDVTVKYKVAGKTAKGATVAGNGADVQTSTGTVKWSVGTTHTTAQRWITVNTFGDTTKELNETFTVALSSPSIGYILGRSAVTATIYNDDPNPGPSVGVGNQNLVVGFQGDRTISFPVTVSRAQTTNMSMTFDITDGSAVSGFDYGGTLHGTVTIPAGKTTVFVNVTIFHTSTPTTLTFNIHLSALHGPTGKKFIRTDATGTILAG